jgi:hypothetical protein
LQVSPITLVGGDTDKENIVPRVNTIDTSLGPKLVLVRGHRWSPSIYKNARKAGLSIDSAWRASFVDKLTL